MQKPDHIHETQWDYIQARANVKAIIDAAIEETKPFPDDDTDRIAMIAWSKKWLEHAEKRGYSLAQQSLQAAENALLAWAQEAVADHIEYADIKFLWGKRNSQSVKKLIDICLKLDYRTIPPATPDNVTN